MWYNKYIGIPYQNKGRDSSGVDCWGLVRLVYSEQYNINLPSFSDNYVSESTEIIQELIAQYKEGWDATTEPQQGDIILFKVLGTLSHVGIYLGNNSFMHAREGVGTVVIESTTSHQWQKRIAGYYKYSKNTNAILNTAPHPLHTESFTDEIAPGTTITELIELINTRYKVPKEIKADYAVMLDGCLIAEDLWSSTVIKPNQKIEYRALVKGSGARTLLMFVVVAIAYAYAPTLGASLQTAIGGAGTIAVGSASAAYVVAASIAINIAGMALVNAIAPVRQPDKDKTTDPGSARSMNLFSGGSNNIAKYAPIPVVLGKVRVTPPLGAEQFVEFTGSEQSRLNSLLVWGFGPVEVSDIQVGTSDLENYSNYKIETLYGLPTDDTTNFDKIYGSDINQVVSNEQLIKVDPAYNPDGLTGSALNPPRYAITAQKCTSISIALHFPEGLRSVRVKGAEAGASLPATFTAEIAYRKLNDSLLPINGEDWIVNKSSTGTIAATNTTITAITYPSTTLSVITGEDGGAYSYYPSLPGYRWTRVYVSEDNRIIFLNGAITESQYAEPSAAMLARFTDTRYGGVSSNSQITKRLPDIPSSGVLLYDYCVYGTEIVSQTAYNTASRTGLVLSFAPVTYIDEEGGIGTTQNQYAKISTGSLVRPTANNGQPVVGQLVVALGAEGQEFYLKKDAFTYLVELSNLQNAYYEVRVTRTNYSTFNPDADVRPYYTSYLYSVTGKANNKPAINPPGCYIAKTALSILSSNNVNGRLEGINGLVHSICLDWNKTTQTWTNFKTTNNPASLFLHILLHPANAFKLSLDFTKINLVDLGSWHEYCELQGFTFNSVLDSQRSVLEVLKDIAAAGRASPTLIDGRWSVVIDRPRLTVTQHFTSHNSWGFEGVKVLPRQPDAFRVVFRNEEKAYQDEQIIVPNIGYTEETAAIIEEISLPGITNRAAAIKHARWHLAQLRLRPEVYSLNSDFEYLVCNRGDVVRVSHDVPMWGTGTGRINTRVSATTITIDEPVYLEANKSYNIRIRTAAGLSVLKTLAPITTTQYYTTIALHTNATLYPNNTVTTLEAASGNLFMIGELNRESEELVVLSIEPMGNTSARLTLTDYSPEIYAVDTSSEYPIPNYDPNLTQLPEKLIDTITQVPQISANEIVSDESVLTVTNSGQLISNIRVPFNNLKDQSKITTHVEVQYDYAANQTDTLQFSTTVDILSGNAVLTNVEDGVAYKLHARYLTDSGIRGPWSGMVTHTVVGKTTPPSAVTGFGYVLDTATGKLQLKWSEITDLDRSEYEVRDTNTGWGLNDAYLFKGSATTCFVDPAGAGSTKTFFIKSIDVVNNYSNTATSLAVTIAAPAAPDAIFNQTSLTNSNAKFNWAAGSALANSIDVVAYEVELVYTTPIAATIQTQLNALSWEAPATWTGAATFRVRAVDVLQNASAWSQTITITANVPQQVGAVTATTSGTDLYLDWEDITRTSLPVLGYEIRETNTNWGSTGSIWKGSLSNASISLIGKTAGTYTWYIRAYDTRNEYSNTSQTVSYTIAQPAAPVIGTPVFQDTSLTNASVTLTWTSVDPVFGLYGYEVTYETTTNNVTTTNTVITKTNIITIPASWLGDKTISVKTIDNLLTATTSNKSIAGTRIVTVSRPNRIPLTSYRAQVIDNTVLLYWELPEISTLPIASVRIKKGGTSWETAEPIGDKAGTFTSFSELSKGTYTYRIAVVDTDGNESDSISLTTEVSQPPNYVFNRDFVSTFAGSQVTLVNAYLDTVNTDVILPVNLTETWQEHFVNNNFGSPQAQISAGYPIYIQPGLIPGTPDLETGSYTEIFDYITVLASSQITLSIGATVLAGTVNVTYKISTSLDGVTYKDEYTNVNSIFSTQFRYIKVFVQVTQTTTGGLYKLDSVSVRLDSKQKSDSNNVIAYDGTALVNGISHVNGTIANFGKEFIDITSINVTPNSTTPLIAVYDFLDTVKTGTYSITSNVCTITIPTVDGVAHNLMPGQLVRVFFTSGTGISGLYTVLTATTNTYTFSITTANTSGNVSTYPNSMRVYVYDKNGVRQNNVQVSWTVSGY